MLPTLIVYPIQICIRGCTHIRHTYRIWEHKLGLGDFSTVLLLLYSIALGITLDRGRTRHAEENQEWRSYIPATSDNLFDLLGCKRESITIRSVEPSLDISIMANRMSAVSAVLHMALECLHNVHHSELTWLLPTTCFSLIIMVCMLNILQI